MTSSYVDLESVGSRVVMVVIRGLRCRCPVQAGVREGRALGKSPTAARCPAAGNQTQATALHFRYTLLFEYAAMQLE